MLAVVNVFLNPLEQEGPLPPWDKLLVKQDLGRSGLEYFLLIFSHSIYLLADFTLSLNSTD